MNVHVAALAARRILHVSVLVALGLAIWIALGAGTASEVAEGLVTSSGLAPEAARAAAWTEAAWTTFLALVVPCVVYRAAALRPAGETLWMSVSRGGGASSSASFAVGALAAALALALAWSAFVAAGPAPHAPVQGFAGRASGPDVVLFDHERSLTWRANVPAESGLRAHMEASLVISAGGGGELRFTARRDANDSSSRTSNTSDTRVGSARVLPSGGVDVDVPGGEGEVEFELSLPEIGARGYVVSDDVTLWRDASAGAPKMRLAARVALALCAWTLLAFGLGAWMSPMLALGSLALTWCAMWWSELPYFAYACIPGASLARDLAIVSDGRAPTSLAWTEFAGAALCALVGVTLARRRAEGRT